MIKAIGMMSGGLDSTLAAKVIQNQGIEVIGVSFKSAFFGPQKAEAAAEKVGVDLRVIDITKTHLDMVKSPKHGYGGNMNPCIDCHGMMFKYAIELMKEEGGSFVFSGEVLGQRPMSQNLNALKVVAKLSGEPDKILRPMSARCMKETELELSGVVDRSKLLDIQGRSRKRQIALAKEWEIYDYPSPAGGCLLTDVGFSNRLRDLFLHNKDCKVEDIETLKLGRHIRLNEKAKVIIGRDESENEKLSKFSGKHFTFFDSQDVPGPLVVLYGLASEEDSNRAARICAGYGKGAKSKSLTIAIRKESYKENPEVRTVEVRPASKKEYAGQTI